MTELEYAFLAEFVKVDAEAGTLTAVGIGARRLAAPKVPAALMFWVGGLVSIAPGTSAELGISVTRRDGTLDLRSAGHISPAPHGAVVEGKMTVAFASALSIPVISYGLFDVKISIDAHEVRTLTFEVVAATGPSNP